MYYKSALLPLEFKNYLAKKGPFIIGLADIVQVDYSNCISI